MIWSIKNKPWCYWKLFIDALNKMKFFFCLIILLTFLSQILAVTMDNVIEYESEIKNINYTKKPENTSIWKLKELEGVSFMQRKKVVEFEIIQNIYSVSSLQYRCFNGIPTE